MTDTVTAHHDYEAHQDDELSFITGDIIKVTDHSNADWWLGTKQDGSSGYFPSNFVEALKEDNKKPTATTTVDKEDDTVPNNEKDKKDITTKETKETVDEAPSPPSPEQQEQPRSSIGMARVMEDYAMQQDDELTLHKGAIVVLYERSEDGEWLQGEINGKQGRFPAKYVEDIDMPGRPDLGTNNTAEMTSGSGDAGATGAGAPPGGFKLAAFGVKQGGIGGLFAGGIPTLKKTSTVKSPTTESKPTTTPPPVTASPPAPSAPSPAATEQHPSLGKAMVLHPYDAENDDELNLIRGEYIDILDRHADEGWWQGRNEKNQTGVFPSNFVKEIEVGQDAPPPPVRTRKSVASVGAVTATPSPPPTETRPFSTPTPTLQQHRPPTISQRLPPLPDTNVPTTEQVGERDADELKVDSPVADSAPAPSSPPVPEHPVAPVDQPQEESLPSPTKEQDKAAIKEQTVPVETSQAIEQSPTTDSPTMPAATTEDTTSAAAMEDDTTPAAVVEDTTPASTSEDTTPPAAAAAAAAPAEEEKEKEHAEVDKKDITLTTTKQQEEETSTPSVETSEPKDTEAVAPATSTVETVEEPKTTTTTTTTTADDEAEQQEPKDVEQEDTKKGIDFGMPLPTSGPRLVAPSRTSRPSKAGARRPPTKPSTDDASPSQTELLQQELEKTPEEEKPVSPAADTTGSPTSPPPKPIKPIFAKFPTAFAMGGGEGISAKNLKPVQRRMFEPAPAHEPSPSPPPSNDNDENRPTPGGVRGLASRFAGVPSSGGGNEVMETKLKNFTKNEVEKQRKEFEAQLEVERARIASLEMMVASLMQQVDQLKNGTDV